MSRRGDIVIAGGKSVGLSSDERYPDGITAEDVLNLAFARADENKKRMERERALSAAERISISRITTDFLSYMSGRTVMKGSG